MNIRKIVKKFNFEELNSCPHISLSGLTFEMPNQFQILREALFLVQQSYFILFTCKKFHLKGVKCVLLRQES